MKIQINIDENSQSIYTHFNDEVSGQYPKIKTVICSPTLNVDWTDDEGDIVPKLYGIGHVFAGKSTGEIFNELEMFIRVILHGAIEKALTHRQKTGKYLEFKVKEPDGFVKWIAELATRNPHENFTEEEQRNNDERLNKAYERAEMDREQKRKAEEENISKIIEGMSKEQLVHYLKSANSCMDPLEREAFKEDLEIGEVIEE